MSSLHDGSFLILETLSVQVARQFSYAWPGGGSVLSVLPVSFPPHVNCGFHLRWVGRERVTASKGVSECGVGVVPNPRRQAGAGHRCFSEVLGGLSPVLERRACERGRPATTSSIQEGGGGRRPGARPRAVRGRWRTSRSQPPLAPLEANLLAEPPAQVRNRDSLGRLSSALPLRRPANPVRPPRPDYAHSCPACLPTADLLPALPLTRLSSRSLAAPSLGARIQSPPLPAEQASRIQPISLDCPLLAPASLTQPSIQKDELSTTSVEGFPPPGRPRRPTRAGGFRGASADVL